MQTNSECGVWARGICRFAINASSVIWVALILAVTGCSTARTNWESIRPAVVSGDRQWTGLSAGMTETEFLNAMSANGHTAKSVGGLPYALYRVYSDTARDDSLGEILVERHTYHYPYALYNLAPDTAGQFRLVSAPIESSCTYSPYG